MWKTKKVCGIPLDNFCKSFPHSPKLCALNIHLTNFHSLLLAILNAVIQDINDEIHLSNLQTLKEYLEIDTGYIE